MIVNSHLWYKAGRGWIHEKSMRQLRAKLKKGAEIARRFGIRALLAYALYRSLEVFVNVTTFVGIRLEETTLAPEYVDLPAGVRFRHGAPSELEAIVQDPDMDTTPDFARGAVRRGDSWYILVDEGKIVSSLWCSSLRTEVVPGLDACFNRDWTYTLKGYTPVACRGRRLAGTLHGLVLRDVRGDGRRGLLGIVDITNFASLRSLQRVGYRQCALFHVLRTGRSVWIWNRRLDDDTGLHLVKSDG